MPSLSASVSCPAWAEASVRPQKREPLEHGNGLFSPVDAGGACTREGRFPAMPGTNPLAPRRRRRVVSACGLGCRESVTVTGQSAAHEECQGGRGPESGQGASFVGRWRRGGEGKSAVLARESAPPPFRRRFPGSRFCLCLIFLDQEFRSSPLFRFSRHQAATGRAVLSGLWLDIQGPLP